MYKFFASVAAGALTNVIVTERCALRDQATGMPLIDPASRQQLSAIMAAAMFAHGIMKKDSMSIGFAAGLLGAIVARTYAGCYDMMTSNSQPVGSTHSI